MGPAFELVESKFGGLLPAQEAAQLIQHLDEGFGVVVAGLDVEAELGAAAVEARFQLKWWRSTSG
jgi:hypothetical protein